MENSAALLVGGAAGISSVALFPDIAKSNESVLNSQIISKRLFYFLMKRIYHSQTLCPGPTWKENRYRTSMLSS